MQMYKKKPHIDCGQSCLKQAVKRNWCNVLWNGPSSRGSDLSLEPFGERNLEGYYGKRGGFGQKRALAFFARSADVDIVVSLLINNSSFLIPDISQGWL